MVLKICLTVLVMIGGLLTYAALKSPQAEILREISVNSTPEKLFPYLNNSQKMSEWMPWKDSDPDLNMIYSGPAEGVGSKSSWDSTGKMGTGTAEITESIQDQLVKTKLEYTKPMVMSQMASMSLTPEANGTVMVRWAVNGQNSFFFRVIGIFVSMDKVVGDEFNKGLMKLKTISEREN